MRDYFLGTKGRCLNTGKELGGPKGPRAQKENIYGYSFYNIKFIFRPFLLPFYIDFIVIAFASVVK